MLSQVFVFAKRHQHFSMKSACTYFRMLSALQLYVQCTLMCANTVLVYLLWHPSFCRYQIVFFTPQTFLSFLFASICQVKYFWEPSTVVSGASSNRAMFWGFIRRECCSITLFLHAVMEYLNTVTCGNLYLRSTRCPVQILFESRSSPQKDLGSCLWRSG